MRWLFFVLVIGCCLPGISQNRKVAITIDDLPATGMDSSHYEYITKNLLRCLKSYDVPAIGFVNESRLYSHGKPDAQKIEVLEEWLKANMDLGNHTFSHVYINSTPIGEYKSDVLRGEIITRPLLGKYGKKLTYFRHTQLRTGPTDNYRKQLNDFLNQRGYIVAPVTIDNDEYIYANCYAKAKRSGDQQLMNSIARDYISYMESIFNFYEKLSLDYFGYEIPQILLLHANSLNADYLDELIVMITNRDYAFVTLTEALQDKAYSLPEGTHAHGLSWIQRWMIFDGKNPKAHPSVSKFILDLSQ